MAARFRVQKGSRVLIVTTNRLPGWEIQRVCGEVFGTLVSRLSGIKPEEMLPA